jgi:hypothetical protein
MLRSFDAFSCVCVCACVRVCVCVCVCVAAQIRAIRTAHSQAGRMIGTFFYCTIYIKYRYIDIHIDIHIHKRIMRTANTQ